MQSSGRVAETVAPLRKMIDSGQSDTELFFMLGRALSAAGDRDAAMWPLRRAMEDPDWLDPAGTQLARDAFQSGNYDTAIKTTTRLLDSKPENVQALTLRARARIESRRNLEEALVDAERAFELSPDREAARIARVMALLALEMEDEAMSALAEIEALAYETDPDQPDSARYCGARATFARERGDLELADERYASCLERYPGSEVLVEDAIKFYEPRGEGERVLEILEAAVADVPDSRPFRVGFALRLAAAGRVEEAEAVFREATQTENPTLAATAWLDLAALLVQLERFDDGIEAMQEGLEFAVEPPPDLVFRLADTLVVAGRLDEALAVAESMSVAAHQYLVRGRVHLERGDYVSALEALDAGLRDWPENAVARYYAAIAAEGIGDYNRAIGEYRYSMRSSAAQTDARWRLAKLHIAEGMYEDALAILRHDVSATPPTPEMVRLELGMLARVSGQTAVPGHLKAIVRVPGEEQRYIAAIAEGLSLRAGPEAAVGFLEQIQVDFAVPANGPLLVEMIRYLADANRAAEGIVLASSGVEANPGSAVFHAALGLARLAVDPEALAAKEAFDRALELDPGQSYALAGLARVAELEGDVATAVDLYLRSDQAASLDPKALRAAISLLVDAGRNEEAEHHLLRLLEREPYSGQAALRLVELRVARGAGSDERTRALARLALRFGGRGAAAEQVLAPGAR